MKAPFDFVIEPKGGRYNNTKKVGDKELILNTEIFNHQFINREAIVKSVPTACKTKILSVVPILDLKPACASIYTPNCSAHSHNRVFNNLVNNFPSVLSKVMPR